MINTFDAAIFDMDGTILDSLGIWEKIDYDFLEKRRGIRVPADYVHAIAAMSYTEIAEYTKKRFGLKETPAELMREWTQMATYEYANNIRLKPYAKEYIEYLKAHNKKIVLCTSSPIHFYEPALKNNGIYDLFDAFTSTCEAGEGKNSPRVYLLAAQKAETEKQRCIVFEDIVPAAQCAKNAGMTVCGVYDERNSGYEEKLREICDYYIGGFGELLN